MSEGNVTREANLLIKRSREDMNMENFDERPATILRPVTEGETREIGLVDGMTCRTVRIGSGMELDLQVNLIGHVDVFAFLADEMPGIIPDVMVHMLNVDKAVRPVKQKKRTFS